MITVRAYLLHNVTYDFRARDNDHAREIAKRIITEGLCTTDGEGVEIFYPITKVKILEE